MPGPAADHNGITIRIGTLRQIVSVHKPQRVYPVSGCAKFAANRTIITALETAQIVVEYATSISTASYDTARRLAEW